MTIGEIDKWIEDGKDYDVGIKILEEVIPNHPKLYVLKKFGDLPAHIKWLDEILTEYRNQKHEKRKKPTEQKTFGKWFKPDLLSENLREEYYNRVTHLFNERQLVHRQFDPQKPQSHNAQISQRLKEISTQLDGFFERAKKYVATGEEQNNGLFARYKTQERLVQTHREYISRRKAKPGMKLQVEERQRYLDKDLIKLKELEDKLYELT